MSLLPVFVNSQLDVRSGWKLGAYTAMFVVLLWVTGVGVTMLFAWADPAWLLASQDIRFLALSAIVLFVPSISALLLMARFDQISVAAYGLALHERWLRDFGLGFAVSLGMLGLALSGYSLFGDIEMQWNGSASVLPAAGLTLGVLLLSAANEELVFRGYPLQVLMKGIGPWAAMLLISSVWGWLHSRNPGVTGLGVANTILAGVFFSRAYLETRSLWLPYGIHAGWNVGTAVVMGLPVSGIQTASLLVTDVTGPDSLLGGSYGPEGGLLVTLVFATGAAVIRRIRIGKISPQINAALASHADKVYIERS